MPLAFTLILQSGWGYPLYVSASWYMTIKYNLETLLNYEINKIILELIFSRLFFKIVNICFKISRATFLTLYVELSSNALLKLSTSDSSHKWGIR